MPWHSGFSSRPSHLYLLILFVSALVLRPVRLGAQDPDPRMVRVEESLSEARQIRGEAPEVFTILERMAHYHVPGVSIAVLDQGRIAWAKGYGVVDVSTDIPVNPETLFQAASISKPLAAMAALRLMDQGVLDLDTPVNNYLTSWKIPENGFTEKNPVTLRHLLTHTGGLTVHGFPGYARDAQVPTTVQVLNGTGPANTDPVRVDTLPGSIWRYSGGGYTVVQQLLVDVTGKSFPELMRQFILDPAGMTLSSYAQPLPPERQGFAASAHLSDGSLGDGKWHTYPEMAAAGLWTNPTELARLALDIQASQRGDPAHILSQNMTRNQLTPGLGGYGLGFAVSGNGPSARFSHGGSNYGFRAQFLAFVEGGRGAFVMTNGDNGSLLAQEIILAVAKEYSWPEPRYQEVSLVAIPRERLEEIAGTYRLQGQDVQIRVLVRGDYLTAEVADPSGVAPPQVMELRPMARNLFLDLTNGTRFRVERNETGAVTALQVIGGPKAIRVRDIPMGQPG